MDDILISKTISFVKKQFESDSSGHDFEHTYRVYKMACKIGTVEGINSIEMKLAALLHDVDDCKVSNSQDLAIVKEFLKQLELADDRISHICNIINEVSFRGSHTVPTTICGKIVQDADRIDAIGAIGIARTFAYGGAKGQKIYDPTVAPRDDITKDNYYSGKTTTINHFYEKLLKLSDMLNTQTAKAMARERHDFMKNFLTQFYKEYSEIE